MPEQKAPKLEQKAPNSVKKGTMPELKGANADLLAPKRNFWGKDRNSKYNYVPGKVYFMATSLRRTLVRLDSLLSLIAGERKWRVKHAVKYQF